MEIFEKINDYGVIPSFDLEDANDAVALAKALVKGGIPIIEVTTINNHNLESIKRIAQEVPEVMVGAGNIHNVEQAQKVLEHGGKFVITPGFDEKVVEWCVKHNLAVCPGVVVPSDIEAAKNFGLKVLNFFPAQAFGGISTLKSYASSFSDIKFIASGGIDLSNLGDYLNLLNVAAVEGSLIKKELVEQKDWTAVTNACDKINELVYDFSVGHVGINTANSGEAEQVVDRIAHLFGTDKRETPIAFFSGNLVEVMKQPFLGAMGHICVDTRNLARAMAMLKRKGVEFDEANNIYDAKGKLMTAYMKEEIGGFAYHIRRRPGI